MKHKSRRKKSSAKATNPTKQNNTVTKDERDLKSMKEWIKSLTFESLVDALAFKFHTTEDETGSSTSHEFDLLLEMSSSRQQTPDNMSHRMGSEYSLDSNPCLFRWRVIDDTEIEKESEGSITKSDANKTQTSVPPVDPLASILGAGTTGLPSELLDVLAQAGVKRSTSALLETFNEVDELDEAFNSLEDCQNNMKQNINDTHQSSPPLPTNFSIQHGILDNGTFLCATIEQQNADRSILSWASLMRDRQLNTGEKKNNQTKSTLPKCILNIPNDPAKEDEKQHKKILLDTLHVVSRGKFLSSAGEQRRTYLAPWFDPTQEWFSLPMYLASRFEASLWDAYLHHSVIQTDEILRENDSLVHSVKSLDADAIERVLYHAFGLAMRNEISESINNLSSSSTTSDTIQEMLLWQLLSCNENGNQLTKTSERWDDFAITPLLEWGSPQSKLKCYIVEYLHEGLAHEAERSLIQSTSLECCCQNPKTSKKKKKRPKKKSHSNQSAAKKVNDIVHQRECDQSSEDDDDEPRVESIIHPTSTPSTQPEFSDSRMADHPPESEINSAKMTVLKVLDDILNDVFTRLCVQGDDFLDFTDTNSLTVKSRGGSSPLRELKRRKPVSVDKTLSADDLEEAATAVVSNIGSSVNAAMDFLQSNVRTPSQSSVQSQQLWASRIRRPSLAETDKHNEPTRLKRSMSSGDSSMLKKPPVHPNISNQPTRAHSGERGSVLSSSGSPLFLQDSQNETSIFDGAPLCLSGALDGWNGVASKNQPEETSIITDLLNTASPDTDQVNLASSTAASIASSVEDAGLDIELLEYDDLGVILDVKTNPLHQDRDVSPMPHDTPTLPDKDVSPPPSAPPTPPATVSPILVSLADLGKLRKEAVVAERQAQETEEDEKLNTKPPLFSGTPPKVLSPTASRPALKPSRSRDDLRSIDEYRKPHRRDRDDHHTLGHRQVDALLSYRNVVAKSVPRKPPSIKSYDGKQKHRDDTFPNMGRSTRSIRTTRSSIGWSPGPAEFPSLISSVTSMPKVLHLDVVCARSESGLDGVDDASHCNVIPRAQADDTLTKDGATTISSVNSPQRDAEQTEQAVSLKEERDAYRDMCLTLGAENAKLRNLLASATCTPLYNPTTTYPQEVSPYFYPNNGEQQPWPIHNQFPNQFTSHSIVAMSDAGHRVDYESSAMSEDDGTSDHMHPSVVAIESQSISWQARGDSVAHSFSRRTSAGGTYAESDTSLEHNIGQESYAFSGLNRVHHHDSLYGPTPLHGIESRLSKDITRYMIALQSQLKKTENVRLRAVEAMTKTIKALWPRAQIKMYGSHVTKLCLPSSDMDFVISLPAVHKNAPAGAAGDLEGRNAIVETNQKVLARKLKSEAWLDQRTIKVIERTAVPVIKVSTKDTRSRVLQLDLSFDAKEHHGLEALNMIQIILEQLPMVRPLVLVLKQFLLDRGLLTAYTGGLSSYCLFLMVARYCQEQGASWNDCGSLLMGLLDFYGNSFDARTTGISVRTRRYFFRSQDVLPSQQHKAEQGWNPQFPDLTKRNSFSNRNHITQRQFNFQNTQSQQFKSGNLDPIWVEDPLNSGNNVGRNAFRIFQVQRAFSDAHRALIASLEWDINSEFGDDVDYPLLKCLLQNEDVFFAIDDPVINR